MAQKTTAFGGTALGNRGRLPRWLETILSPGSLRESALACFSQGRRLRQRIFIIFRSFRTARGRVRLRLSLYGRIPCVVMPAASLYRRTLGRRARVVAIVGSFGKTTTARAVLASLGLDDSLHTGSNAGTGLADALLRISPQAKHAVIEAAISDKGQMERHAHLLKPDIAVVTSIGSEHMTSLGSLEVTRAEKAKMVSAIPPSGLVVLNGDDANVLWMRDLSRARVITYGFGESNHVRATDVVENELSGIRFKLHMDGDVRDVRARLIGRHMIYPILAAVAVAQAEGRDLRQSIAALEELEPTYNRLQPIQLANGAWLLLDAYKAALETIEVALDALSELSANRKIAVLGDVEEPPGSTGPIHKALGKHLSEVCDHIIFVGTKRAFRGVRLGAVSGGLPRDALMNMRTDPHAIVQALEIAGLGTGDIVLIKGRCNQHLERVALLLTGNTVKCSIRFCSRRHDCESCPLLQRPM